MYPLRALVNMYPLRALVKTTPMTVSNKKTIVMIIGAVGILSASTCLSTTFMIHRKKSRRLSGYMFDPRTVERKQQSPQFYIIQASPPRSGSTLIANLLTGLFDAPNNDMCFLAGDFFELDPHNPSSCIRKSHVVKTHVPEVDRTEAWFRSTGVNDVFFISTNREGVTLAGDAFCARLNVLCMEYGNILYSNQDEMRIMVSRVATRIREEIPLLASSMNEEGGFQRLVAMEGMTKSMAELPFTEVNSKFSIHGGHREHWGKA